MIRSPELWERKCNTRADVWVWDVMDCPCEERLHVVYLSHCELLFSGPVSLENACTSAALLSVISVPAAVVKYPGQSNLWTDESLKVGKSWWQEIEQLVTLCVLQLSVF